jgi:hypothetical protein
LELEKNPDVWRFHKNRQYLVDFIFTRVALFKRVLTEYEKIRINGVETKVPKVECALAMKFAAMTGHYRSHRKKHLDAADFMSIVEKNSELDMALLHELGELNYSGGGDEISQYVADVRAGRNLEI